MDPSLKALHEILKINERLFINSLDGVDEDTAKKRIKSKLNSIIYVTCHLLDARYYIAGFIGINDICPYKELFDKANDINDLKEYPPLEGIKASWKNISTKINARMMVLSEANLAVEAPVKLPVEDNSLMGTMAFIAEHEAYHIGQIGFIRKYFGIESVKYT